MGPRVTGDSLYGDLDGVVAGGSDRQQAGRAAVPVESQFRIPQLVDRDVSRSDKSHFFLDRPEQGERRMRQALFENLQDGRQHNARAGAVVPAEGRRWLLWPNDRAIANRLAANAQRHGIDMSHQKPSRPLHRARQFDDQVAHLSADAALFMSRVRRDGRSWHTRVSKLLLYEIRNGFLFAALSGNGHHLCDETDRRVFVEQVSGESGFSFSHRESISVRRVSCEAGFL